MCFNYYIQTITLINFLPASKTLSGWPISAQKRGARTASSLGGLSHLVGLFKYFAQGAFISIIC
jgi:hypothetical protein